MSLRKYIAQRNQMATLFGRPTIDPKNLTAEVKLELAKQVLCDLSPENLCCDGELRGAKLRAKAAMLNAAKADLEALGQPVEWDVLYPRETL